MQAGIFEAKLFKDWGNMARAQLNVAQFVKESVKRPLDDGNMVVFFNNKLVSIHFLLSCYFISKWLTENILGYKQVLRCRRNR